MIKGGIWKNTEDEILKAAVMKYGLGYVDELHSGLSYLLEERGFRSVKELIGSALPKPITLHVETGATAAAKRSLVPAVIIVPE